MVIVARVPNIVVVGPISCYVTMVDHRLPIVFVTTAPIHICRKKDAATVHCLEFHPLF